MVLKPKPRKARVLTTPRGLADVSVSENHVRSLLLLKVILSLETWLVSDTAFYSIIAFISVG